MLIDYCLRFQTLSDGLNFSDFLLFTRQQEMEGLFHFLFHFQGERKPLAQKAVKKSRKTKRSRKDSVASHSWEGQFSKSELKAPEEEPQNKLFQEECFVSILASSVRH